VWGWSMRSNLWPAGTISGSCAVRYSGLRFGGYKQGSNEGHEKDSGTHAGIVVAITPWGQRTILLRFARRRSNWTNKKRTVNKVSP
jgi:hypothetical protein